MAHIYRADAYYIRCDNRREQPSLTFDSSHGNVEIRTTVGDFIILTGNPLTEILRITADGHVHIGTPGQDATLQIHGNLRLSGTLYEKVAITGKEKPNQLRMSDDGVIPAGEPIVTDKLTAQNMPKQLAEHTIAPSALSLALVADGQVLIREARNGAAGQVCVAIDPADEHCFYLVSCRIVGPPSVDPVSITWQQTVQSLASTTGVTDPRNCSAFSAGSVWNYIHQVLIENGSSIPVLVDYQVYRLN